MSGIIWLASYPKSGNTWLRALLTNALQPIERPANINTLLGVPVASSRKLFDDWSGLKSSDLTCDEIEHARPLVYEALARSTSRRLFIKTHDAFTLSAKGEPLFPLAATSAVIYVVRHPADVAQSYAHHRGCSEDEAVKLLADDSHTLAASGEVGVEGQLPQRLLSWSGHVSSWLDSPHRVHCVKYEDLHKDAEGNLRRILEFLGEDVAESKIARAVQSASFAEMRRQEAERGFFEAPSNTRTFFRSGKIASRKFLKSKNLRSMEVTHGTTIRRIWGPK